MSRLRPESPSTSIKGAASVKLGLISYEHTKENLDKIADLGLDFVEYCVNYNPDAEQDKWRSFCGMTDDIAAWVTETGLFVGSVGRWGGIKILPDGSVNEEEYRADEALIHAAARLSCPVYNTGCNYVEELSLYENYTAAIGYFKRLLELGQKLGVRIATYNCRWNNYVHSDPAWSVIHGHLPKLGIKYDPSHCRYAMGEDYLSEMKKWGSRFAHVHIKGSLIVDGERLDDPPAGLDQTNWGAFMATLYACGYDGTLSIEPHSSVWQGECGDKGLRYSIRTMRSLMFR